MDNKTIEKDGYNDLNRPLDNKHEGPKGIGPVINSCPDIPFFGARYPDATCHDGYLWDLDSWESELGGCSKGGEDPCPFCNQEEFIQNQLDNENGTREQIIEFINDLIIRYGNK